LKLFFFFFFFFLDSHPTGNYCSLLLLFFRGILRLPNPPRNSRCYYTRSALNGLKKSRAEKEEKEAGRAYDDADAGGCGGTGSSYRFP
jgi:hypothetical protein